MTDKYILDENGNPIAEPDLLKWAEWLQNAKGKRHIAQDYLEGGVHVSTVFLGLDHSFTASPPLLYETLIFGGEHDQYQERYSTREEALAGHAVALNLASERDGRMSTASKAAQSPNVYDEAEKFFAQDGWDGAEPHVVAVAYAQEVNKELLEVLERLLNRYYLLLAQKPVRDASETIAEAEAAIAKARGAR